MFAYCGNDPTICYDPSGSKLVISPTGGDGIHNLIDRIIRNVILRILSRITNDELKCDDKSGEVIISNKSDSPEKEVGTNLIRSLCNDDNTIVVCLSLDPVIDSRGKYIGSFTKPVCFGSLSSECNSIIVLDPSQASIENVGLEIILSHELIHAHHIATNTLARSRYDEECRTVGIVPYAIYYYSENAIRAENGYPSRTKY